MFLNFASMYLRQVIASIGLDKKLYTLDSGSRRPVSCIPYEAPFSSLAFRDDGNILAAGTSGGRVVFYDVRGKPQPFTVLRAYGNSEASLFQCYAYICLFGYLNVSQTCDFSLFIYIY